jgi:hypothetical protein
VFGQIFVPATAYTWRADREFGEIRGLRHTGLTVSVGGGFFAIHFAINRQ